MIPKTVHYIWLGGKPKPPLTNICILSWHEKLSDYKIIEWNESNIDLDAISSRNRFFAECRKRSMWAYMADYLRLKVLYEHGGIYMDTDMQVVKNLDPLLYNTSFIGEESKDIISCGIIACMPYDQQIKKALDYYDAQIWTDQIWTIPSIISKVFEDIVTPNVKIYPQEYFYPFSYGTEFNCGCIKDSTYTIHWWNGSWINNLSAYLFLSTKHIRNPVLRLITRIKKSVGFYIYRSKK